jgi:septum formation protein
MNGPAGPHSRIVLASASPRRTVLLEQAGIAHSAVPSGIEELEGIPGADPCCTAIENAVRKAEAVARTVPADTAVIGADTVAVLADGAVLGKPADRKGAFAILSTLSGTTHTVLTGVAVICTALQLRETFCESTAVTMKPMSPEMIREYIDSGEPFGKAGAYAIQENGDRFVEKIEGDFDTVVGLPVRRIRDLLSRFGFIAQPE